MRYARQASVSSDNLGDGLGSIRAAGGASDCGSAAHRLLSSGYLSVVPLAPTRLRGRVAAIGHREYDTYSHLDVCFVFKEKPMSGKAATKSPYTSAVEALSKVERERRPDEEFVRRIGAVLDELPQLSAYRWELVLAMESVLKAEHAVEAMAGGPAAVIGEVSRENLVRAGARRRVLDEPMLEAESVARFLGSRSVNRGQYASQRRRRGELLGIPVANRYLFPAFQIDEENWRIRPVVSDVNRLLDAAEDPWGAASWWFSPNSRLGGARPADVAVDESRQNEVRLAANSLLAPIG
jgi:hypothetical protein